MDQEAAARSLRGCALFSEVSDADMADVVRGLRRRRFRKHEVVFHQGDPGDSLHVVGTGSIKITLPSPEGEEAIMATLREGDFFGELSLLDGAPRSASAIAMEPSETWMLQHDVLWGLIDADAALRRALYVGLARELRRLTGQIEELHFLDLGGRLALRIVRLAREREPDANDVRLDWPYTQSDLAAMIGATRQSVNKLLAELVERDLIVIEAETLHIPDVEALEAEADR